MKTIFQESTFKEYGLRDTHTRRLILDVLEKEEKTISAYALQKRLAQKGTMMNIATVYRILAAFEKTGLVHKHPFDGNYSLCTMQDKPGHHGFLRCTDCGKIEEFHSKPLCWVENRIAKAAKFNPTTHVSEIQGLCWSCSD